MPVQTNLRRRPLFNSGTSLKKILYRIPSSSKSTRMKPRNLTVKKPIHKNMQSNYGSIVSLPVPSTYDQPDKFIEEAEMQKSNQYTTEDLLTNIDLITQLTTIPGVSMKPLLDESPDVIECLIDTLPDY